MEGATTQPSGPLGALAGWWSDLKRGGKSSATPQPAAPSLVLPLGPYEATDAVLGEGGYAKVVLGRNRASGEKVAIKLLDTRTDATKERTTAVSSEAAIVREVAALRRAGSHVNVCTLFGYYRIGEGGSCHAMVMELCRGGELFRLVERHGAMDEARIRPLFSGILDGLHHLHAQGIAHRDLKLENILLAPEATGKEGGTPKICDLGLAHVHARGPDGKGWAERELTQFCGSRSYCAPEVMARLGYNGYLADVWSLGVCLFGLVSGFFPVDEASPRDWRFERIARQQHVAPAQSTVVSIFAFYNRPCPLSVPLIDVLDRMLQVVPAKRSALSEIADSPWVHGATSMPPNEADAHAGPPAPAAAEREMEVDIADCLQRSGGSAEACYRSLDLPPMAEGAEPPQIRRQPAEQSVGSGA